MYCYWGFYQRKISERLQSKFQKSLFRQLAGIDNIYGIDLKPYLQQIREAKHIIIYGAGFATEEVVKHLTTYRIEILGFAVSNREDKNLALYGHHVYEISELISYSQEALVLIAANKKYNDEIIELLEKIGFDNYIKLNVEI